MKKGILLVIFALIGLHLCNAQYTEKKAVVAIGDFTGNKGAEMRNAFFSSMPTCRVNVVDWNTVKDTEAAETVDYIITATIGDVATETKQGTRLLTNQTYTYYSCKVSFNLVMTDVKKGKVVATRNGHSTSTNEDYSKAVNDCLKFSPQDCRRLIDNGFVVRVPIQVIQDVKRDRVKTVIIAGGSDIGICEGLYFDVQMESEIAGKKIYKNIGKAKVKEVLSEELTLCEITDGQKDVMKMLDDDVVVVLTSKEEPLIHF